MAFGRKKEPGTLNDSPPSMGSDEGRTKMLAQEEGLSKGQLRRATRTRQIFALISSFFLIISLIFLILVEIGNTSNKPVLRDTWFISLNLSNVIPTTVPNSVLLNDIAQSLGLHDFYNVGLWNYCEGYSGQGVTDCTQPQTLYWFDPVTILQTQLFAGASITLPQNIVTILDIVKTASHWMFGLFLTGACLTTVMIFLTPIALYSRWITLFTMIFSFLNALIVTAASTIATALFIIMANTIRGVQTLNIGTTVGIQMFVFMWIASGFAIAAWLIQLGLSCCCASRRDVKRGKKRGSKKAHEGGIPVTEKPQGQGTFFGRGKASG